MFDKEPYYTEKIEAYLRNELTNSEKADFERLLRQDPLLYNEFTLQQDVMSSIQAYRKKQLKQRLESISVDDLVSRGSSTAKIASLCLGGAFLLGIIGWLAFSGVALTDKTDRETPVVVSEKAVPTNQIPAQARQFPEAFASPSLVPTEAGNKAPSSQPVLPKSTVQKPAPKATIDKTSITKANAQVEDRPLVEETPRKVGLENKGERITAIDEKERTSRLHVTDNTNSKLKHHYYYLNNQITLLGFDQPYILLEIQPENSAYLYYEGQFYHLDTSQRQPSPIKDIIVTDAQLIEKLNERLTERN